MSTWTKTAKKWTKTGGKWTKMKFNMIYFLSNNGICDILFAFLKLFSIHEKKEPLSSFCLCIKWGFFFGFLHWTPVKNFTK